MIVSTKCYKCPCYPFILDSPDLEKAKAIYKEHGTAFLFSCGAIYNPKALNIPEVNSELFPTPNCPFDK